MQKNGVSEYCHNNIYMTISHSVPLRERDILLWDTDYVQSQILKQRYLWCKKPGVKQKLIFSHTFWVHFTKEWSGWKK
jgi:hypothetical protein